MQRSPGPLSIIVTTGVGGRGGFQPVNDREFRYHNSIMINMDYGVLGNQDRLIKLYKIYQNYLEQQNNNLQKVIFARHSSSDRQIDPVKFRMRSVLD